METENKKSYYAIIPAFVRYDKDLTANAKLLYGEITALCNEQGQCWASNLYFSNLYNVSETSISNWINNLIKKGYIERELTYKSGTREVEKRALKIANLGGQENLGRWSRKLGGGGQENLKDNNTNKNNKKENIIKESQAQPPLNSQNEQVVSTGDLDLWFSRIYEIYPRKVSKVQAKKTFEKKLKNFNREEAKKIAVRIYNILKKQIELWSKENDYQGRKLEHIPYFSTWLNANFEDSK